MYSEEVGGGIPGSLQDWSLHCCFSRTQDHPYKVSTSPFLSSVPALCCPLEALVGGWRTLTWSGRWCLSQLLTDDAIPKKEWGFTGLQFLCLILALDKTVTGAIIWQTWLGIIETTEEQWVPRDSSLGPRKRPPHPPPGCTSWARRQHSGHLGQPETPFKATPQIGQCLLQPDIFFTAFPPFNSQTSPCFASRVVCESRKKRQKEEQRNRNSWLGVPVVAQQKQIQLGTMRLQVRALASLSGLRIQHCCELWCRLGPDLGLLWGWPAATALITWEPPYVAGSALKRKKKKKKN